MLIAAVQPKKEWLTTWDSCWFGEDKRTGYVTVTDFCFKKSYGAKDINALKRDTEGIEKRFISLNAFSFGERQTSELRQIRNIGIDLDQYKKGLSISEGLDAIQALILDKVIPEPNLILTSRGIQLFYTVEGGASPDMSWLSSFITEQYISKLRHLGADSNAKDISRVMRVPNSINERNGAIVEPEIWNPHPYTLQELQSFCKPLERFSYRGKKRAAIKRISPKNLSFFYKTNNARLVDLDKLIVLRNGDFTNKRNIFLYVYAYHQSLVCNSLSDTEAYIFDVVERIYSREDKPLSNAEIKRTVKSAYKDSHNFFDHFKKNGFKVIYRHNDGIIKPYKTTNLIKILEITIDEQRALKRIHTGVVSKEKETDRKRVERRTAGVKSRSEYLKERQAIKKQAVSLKEQGYKYKDIADKLGVNINTVKGWFRRGFEA